MKIVFICGSLEPGCDGVGDYTRRLSEHLILYGHRVGIVALNDFYVYKEYNETQTDEAIEIKVLRLPSNWKQEKKGKRAKQWIDQFNPEWLSLQYVIFSFHKKGLPIIFHKQLKIIGKGRNWHIMFHELSVGLNVEASFKEKCWGYVQLVLIRSLINVLGPKVVHTQSKLYQAYLQQYRINAHLLPLFSNIAVSNNNENDSNIQIDLNRKGISLVVFGAIHKTKAVKLLAKEIAEYEKNNKMKIAIHLVGRQGKESLFWIRTFQAAGVEIKSWGEQPKACISKILLNASAGISTTPAALVEKSGTAAAMTEHGLPVLCISDAWTPSLKKKPSLPEGITKYLQGVIETFLSTPKHEPKPLRISEISKQLINTLSNAQRKLPFR